MDKQVESQSSREEELISKFLEKTTLFLGPDPEIMADHDIAPRTDHEEISVTEIQDDALLAIVRDRIQVAANECYEMLEQMGAAPGAKWGDLISGIYTASGDLAIASTGGVLVFSALVHHPIKFIRKYWENDPTVGVRKGDGFIHNDSRYGNIHNTDQSMIIPIFHEGELIAWAGATVHEGENGAIEPGGMPSLAESPYDEGLKMSPFKVVENYELKKDLVTFLQNSVREPKLQYEDMKVKLYCCRRIERRIQETIAEYGVKPVIAALRRNLEDPKEEVRKRISEWPDGTVRAVSFADSTLRENLVVKINLEMRKKGDKLTLDFRGSSPEFLNRANNTVVSSLKGMLAQLFLTFVWPDLPRNQAVFAPIEILVDPRSALNSSYETPNAESMMTFFPAFTAAQLAVAKFLYSTPFKATRVIAPWYNMINTFIYGGVTQHGEMVGNLCADLNGMGGGARIDRDGENAIAPIFATMADIGEQEVNEEEVPFIQILSKKLMRDNQSFGKFRGGMGYQMMAATRGSPFWGFMVCCIGSKISNAPGLFGGYGCSTYPLCKVKGVNTFETMASDPEKFDFSVEDVMNKQLFKGATYSTHHMGLQFELAQEGELYMITQGSGGGYGDVLERDPELVIKDLEADLISDYTARKIYGVVYDPKTFAVDIAATEKLRQKEREARKRRGVPFKKFVKKWSKKEPPAHLPFYGCWGPDRSVIYGGSPDAKMPADAIQSIMMPNPKDVRIAELEGEIAKLARKVQRTSSAGKRAKPKSKSKSKPKPKKRRAR